MTEGIIYVHPRKSYRLSGSALPTYNPAVWRRRLQISHAHGEGKLFVDILSRTLRRVDSGYRSYERFVFVPTHVRMTERFLQDSYGDWLILRGDKDPSLQKMGEDIYFEGSITFTDLQLTLFGWEF